MGNHWSRHQFVVPQDLLDDRCPAPLQRRISSLSRFVRKTDVPVAPETYELSVALAKDARYQLIHTLVIQTEEGWDYIGRDFGVSSKAFPDRSVVPNPLLNAAIRSLLRW